MKYSCRHIDIAGLTRRQFIRFAALSYTTVLVGCAVNPVTGRSQLMLVSEREEAELDRVNHPHQFSSDYGQVQDPALVEYVSSVGRALAGVSHRSDIPYRFVPLNAAYVNAYTFPAGSVGITRGILVGLGSEAELAALIGHELGHVNARHTAQRMSKGVLTSLIVSGVAAYAGGENEKYASLAAGLGTIAAGALLAKYSRDNEREADSLAMDYMVAAGYGPQGHTDLMDMLRSLHKKRPNALELMFASHPMSDERYRDSLRKRNTLPGSSRNLPVHRERYMDRTAPLRAKKAAIEGMQEGDRSMMRKRYTEAEGHYGEALRHAPGDYAGLLMMAKCQLALDRPASAAKFAQDATAAYPTEPQALHVMGIARLRLKDYGSAFESFSGYEKVLPGNPNTLFYKGFSLEKMGNRKESADHYVRYLKKVDSGENATYARGRLKEWGYLK
ncbi:MAG: M48 family metalloprotease [bacterium]|nr:MAG: M48 family metalloprotease [bacterium]